MKILSKLFIIVFVFCLFVNFTSCSTEKIKKSSISHHYDYEDGEKVPDGKSETYYNDNGDEIEKVFFDEEGNISFEIRYEYEYRDDGSIKVKIEYNEDNEKSSETYFNKEEDPTKEIYYSKVLGETTYRLKYNEDSYPISGSSYDEEGKLKNEWTIENTIENGGLKKRSLIFDDSKRVIHFDDEGNQIKSEYYKNTSDGEKLTEVTEYTYNENNDMTSYIVYTGGEKRKKRSREMSYTYK